MRSGPTSANSCPARILFVRTPEAKARLLPALSPSNVDKTRAAPVTAIIGYDTRFYELLPKLFPHRPEMKNPYEANATLAETVAFRNGTLQGAYFMIAARAVGLDVGGMSGFETRRSTPNSSRTDESSRTSSVTSATAIRRKSCRSCRAWSSTKPARSSERHRGAAPATTRSWFLRSTPLPRRLTGRSADAGAHSPRGRS